ncbi:MAG: hypothetical protein WBM09_08950 [Gallionella sp.]
MAYFEKFVRTSYTYEERVEPQPFMSAIGQMAVWFAELEDEVSEAIIKLLKIAPDTGRIVTTELSFRNKVHMMSALVKSAAGKQKFNFPASSLVEAMNELAANCFKAEELRNQILHSSYEQLDRNGLRYHRNKTTAKSNDGLRIVQQPVDAAYMQDVADFIIMVAGDVNEFMLDPE